MAALSPWPEMSTGFAGETSSDGSCSHPGIPGKEDREKVMELPDPPVWEELWAEGKAISGDQLKKLAFDVLERVQHQIGGGIGFLEGDKVKYLKLLRFF